MSEQQKYTETRTFDSDRPMEILGVPGRLTGRTTCVKNVVGTWTQQHWISERRTKVVDGEKLVMHAELRFDDNCYNGHNDFAITGYGWYDHYKTKDWDFGGCCHEMIAAVFPELAPLIKWHLTGTRGPMHYLGNTLYHASNRDHYGLLKGEKRQILAKGEVPMWNLRADATGCGLKTPLSEDEDITNLPLYRLQDLRCTAEMPQAVPRLYWEPCWRIGEGKERQLDDARSCAVWPEATDEQLCLPEPELRALLEARLPQLIDAFRKDMDSIGFYWSPEEFDAKNGG